MSWLSIGTINLTSDWQTTQPVVGEIIRITHLPLFNQNKQYLKATITSAFLDDGINLFQPKRLTYRDEKEIFIFDSPQQISNHVLAFKRLDTSNIEWIIKAEVYQGASAFDNFSSYLIAKFGDAMALYTRTNIQSLDANSAQYQLSANTASKIVSSNSKRRTLTIQNGDKTIILAGVADDKGNLSKVFITLLPNEVYDFPTSQGSIYTGDIFAKCSTDTVIGFTEFTAF